MTTAYDDLAKVWFSPVEIRKITGVGLNAIYSALQCGDLEGTQRIKGGTWRVHRDAVDRWMGRGAA